MKTKPWIVFASVICAGVVLRAEPPPINLILLGPAGTGAKPALPACHVVSGQNAKVRIAVEAPISTRLTVRADLSQIAHGIAAPLASDLPVTEGLSFEDRTYQVIEASIPVPEIKRVTKVLARFRTQVAGEEKWQPAGKALLVVYPVDHLDSFKKFVSSLEADQGLRLGVFAESPRLRAFLREKEIPFEDLGPDFPAAPKAKVIYLGESSAEKLTPQVAAAEEIRLVIFDPESSLLSGVYYSPRSTGFIITVTLPLMDDLLTNPQTQQTFATIFLKALPETPRIHP